MSSLECCLDCHFPSDALFPCTAYNEQEKRAVHKVFLGGGSGFSSPCVSYSSSPRLVYAATLRGVVSAVHAVSQFNKVWLGGVVYKHLLLVR